MNDSPSPASPPLREATSFLTIFAFLFGIGCYFAAVNHVPVFDECLYGIASILYGWFPILAGLKIPQAAQILSALAAAVMFFAAGVPFTPTIARMCGPRIGALEGQMRLFQKKRKPRTGKFS